MAEVPTHQVGAAQVYFLSASVPEIEDAAMLQEPTYNTCHTDVFTHPWHTGTQAAQSTHQQVHPHARL